MKRVSAYMPLRLGLLTLAGVVSFLGFWAAHTEIAGAVIAKGRLMPVEAAHLVSHPDGGVVARVAVRSGQHVAAGDVLVTLDGSALAIELDSVTLQLAELLARQARLQAERAGLTELPNPVEIYRQLPGLEEQRALHAQTLKNARIRLAREVSQAEQRALQVERQITGIQAHIEAVQAELSITRTELERQEDLHKRGLIETRTLAAEQRGFHRQSGELGRLRAEISELEEKLGETRLAALTTVDQARYQAQAELDRIAPQILTLIGRRSDLLHSQNLLEVHAPISGHVYDLQVKGDGFVLRKGAPVLTLIPDNSALQALVRVRPSDIDQVHIAQETVLRFNAYNIRTLPMLYGKIDAVAPDVSQDTLTRETYYDVSVSIHQEDLEGVLNKPVVNGMEVTAFIQTVPQTPLEYVSRPVVDYLTLAFRDR
ncbi:HlyD family type I secretion periplasmic adaptor subunit [Shimia sp. MIT910701]|uniref:HlyD family type I secretion periplasmic adaptor subunit n=1 Tax=Shimia sp. MIT910701 TaxID=3096987 RepID=UPI00399B7142